MKLAPGVGHEFMTRARSRFDSPKLTGMWT